MICLFAAQPALLESDSASHLSAGEDSARCTKKFWFSKISTETVSAGNAPEEGKQVDHSCGTVWLSLHQCKEVDIVESRHRHMALDQLQAGCPAYLCLENLLSFL